MRYEPKLLLKEPHLLLHDHFSLCQKRLQRLYSSLKNNTVPLKKYNDVFLEQKKFGYIEVTIEIALLGNCHYISHHQVIREDKNTSKLRTASDTSARSEGLSVHKCLYKDSRLTPLIVDIFYCLNIGHREHCTKMKFSIMDFFSKCDQIRSFLRIWSHLLKKSIMENFVFCAVRTIFTNWL